MAGDPKPPPDEHQTRVSESFDALHAQVGGRLDDAGRAAIAQGQCINRPLMAEHIARMALFLAADDSALCTAQDFVVDAGWT